MNLSECTKQEINMQVAKIQFPECTLFNGPGIDDRVFIQAKDGATGRSFDYCNDDALAFRLMLDNKIVSLIVGNMESCPVRFFEGLKLNGPCHVGSENENPNRAVAECLILMNQGGDK